MKHWKVSRYLVCRGILMKRFKKKELLEIISTFTEVNEAIVAGDDLDAEAVMAILIQCQENAITIGNSIEEYCECTERIIGLLEEYCEGIYSITVSISQGNFCVDNIDKVKDILERLFQQVEKDIPDDKKEIAFLPYKASMWDSLESVWKRMSVNPEYDVYVIPIPYFDKNADGSLGEMHYEGNEYPEYVPITPYDNYEISVRRPDEIYIHNPYDGYNKVTSVHPAFYSSELRKYTDMLVYIPYFVAVNDNVEKHFCTTPAVLYAHKVIVQSEKVRQTYLDELHRYEEALDCRGALGNLEEKIVAGGSPKFDKVINSKLTDFDIPEDWNQLIIDRDGQRRKVIMYNTSISALLINGNKMIDKMEQVFKVFRKNPEVVLLWRPHPLLKKTIKSMQPALLDRYEELENNYINEKWGIYDDTPDMYRAITLSDGYYGDNSSVAELYKQTNKPIMIQKVDIL